MLHGSKQYCTKIQHMELSIMLKEFLQRVTNGEKIEFAETLAIVGQHYDYRPAAFRNGLQAPVYNPAGSNEGSCKIFSFARLHNLNQAQTLALFGAYYRHDVLGNPQGADHANIRTFMRDGWAGVAFESDALVPKSG
jgi:hypothetical protein